MSRLAKLENGNAMREALSGDMDGNSLDTILKALDAMQDKIIADTDDKLLNFVPKPAFSDLEGETKGLKTKVAANEGYLKKLGDEMQDTTDKLDNHRKRLQRMQGEIDQIKQQSKSQLSMHASPEPEPVEEQPADANASEEARDGVKRMVTRLEGSLVRRISACESQLGKLDPLQDEVDVLKSQMVRALAPKEPVISQDDVDRWNATEDRSKANEEAIARLQKDLQLLDGPKIKADIL